MAFLVACIDSQPPVLSVRPLSEPHHRGAVSVSIFAEPGAQVTTRIDDAPAQSLLGTPWYIDTASLSDGAHALSIEATDAAGNTSAIRLSLATDNTAPTLALAPTSGVQGQTMGLVLTSDEPVAATSATFLDRQRPLYPLEDGRYRALIGIAITQEPGDFPLTLSATDAAGNTAETTIPLNIAAGTFPAGGFIRLSKTQTAARADEPSRARTRKERRDAYTVRSDAPLWDGPLQRPIEGRRTSGFGRYRTYSDGRRSYHYGTDLANITGTPVRAAAAGIALHAGWQHIFGNVVILDHGQGVSTSYNHLSSVALTVGERVEAGEVIGQVGSTGQSTGPHLHWGLVVDGISVDAEQWLAPLPWD
ncbi:MAG: peptidoglycan DD-metalloendopeptidase family protein [Myxococcota bacterium]|nr:peptidoglycan DD-metalloendopeptidase family protein [Myxococcota bacterium]